MHLPNNTLLQGGKYKIVRFINSGGFGCSYEAEHILLETRVAIKEFFIKDFCNRDEITAHVTVGTLSKKGLVEKLRRKFVEEAKALAKLHHPGIVRVSDVFEENGTAYYVMDYIEGQSLSQLLNERGPLPEALALRYIREVGEALSYVHGKNRLHLDIKPGNIMLEKDDEGKEHAILIDFGASKQYDEENGENTSTLMGKTPGYAPLEQMGNRVRKFLPATDIYSLGATLYKLLTGITPPEANVWVTDDDELKPLPANVSVATRNAIKQAMQVKIKERPQCVDDFFRLFRFCDIASQVSKGDVVTPLENGESTLLNDLLEPKETLNTEERRLEKEGAVQKCAASDFSKCKKWLYATIILLFIMLVEILLRGSVVNIWYYFNMPRPICIICENFLPFIPGITLFVYFVKRNKLIGKLQNKFVTLVECLFAVWNFYFIFLSILFSLSLALCASACLLLVGQILLLLWKRSSIIFMSIGSFILLIYMFVESGNDFSVSEFLSFILIYVIAQFLLLYFVRKERLSTWEQLE